MSEASDQPSSATERPRSNLAGWALIAGVGIVLVALRFSASSGGGDGHALVGMPFGASSLQPLSEDVQPLEAPDLRGKVTLINFWGTWCGPCQLELPELIQLHRQFRDEEDFQFVSVTIPQNRGVTDEQLARTTATRLEQLGAEFGFYADPGGATMNHLAMLSGNFGLGVPTTVVVDRTGIIRGVWIGYTSRATAQMEKMVRELLQSGSPAA